MAGSAAERAEGARLRNFSRCPKMVDQANASSVSQRDELRWNEELFRSIFQQASAGMVIITPDGEFVEANPAFCAFLGYARDELLRLNVIDITFPDDRGNTHLRLGEAQSGRRHTFHRGKRYLRRDGSVVWGQGAANWFFGPDGKLLYGAAIIQDATECKRAEQALQTQFNQMRTIFDAIDAVVYVADPESYELLFLNSYGSALFGNDWHGRACYEVLQAGQGKACPSCANDGVMPGQPPLAREFQSRVTGTWHHCIDRSISWTDGRLVRLKIAFDITERKEMERIKDEMISAVSHEMRTPLTAVLGYTALMLENEVAPDEQKSYLHIIRNETERLNALIGNFLDLQRLRARREPRNFRLFQVLPLLEETVALFSGISQRHRFTLDCSPALPPLWGDAARLLQVLNNLVSNAVKYSPEGGEVYLGVSREDDSVVILVRDEGIGMPAQALEKIFDRFYRINNTDRRAAGGTGLGLALVREIVVAHGGKVWVKSAPGKGSTFYVRLPLQEGTVTEKNMP